MFHNPIISYEKEHLQHECGIAVVRLLKPLSYFQIIYNDDAWGLHKACLLLEKQRNRGQDGAGLAIIKEPPSLTAITQYRSTASNALEDLFRQINEELAYKKLAGILYLGHTRYGTYGAQGLSFTQPIVRRHNAPAQTFALCGNFNMTNITQLNEYLATWATIDKSSPSDTKVIRDLLAYYLDAIGVNDALPLITALERAAMHWDGGYVFALATGSGDLLIVRDPAGIRPCFIYQDSDVIAAASERVALMSTFNADIQTIHQLPPGQALLVTADGHISYHQIVPALPTAQCSFERIYFSRGNDPDIYQERKDLGKNLATRVLQSIEYDIEHSIFTFIPNTSEIAFIGLVEEIKRLITLENITKLSKKIMHSEVTHDDLHSVAPSIRIEKIINKDQLLRTFITQETNRLHLIANIYDVTHNVVTPHTRLVVLDDSIVRGATLRESIIKQLIMLNPKEIIIVSSAPPILYPDCYGIDMSQIGKLIGFQAAIAIVKEQQREKLIYEIAQLCKQQESLSSSALVNYVAHLYQNISQEELEEKIAELVSPSDTVWNGKITIIYQTIDGLHRAIPEHTGDWYFTGKYPTPGGYHVLNTSFLQWYCKLPDQRAY